VAFFLIYQFVHISSVNYGLLVETARLTANKANR